MRLTVLYLLLWRDVMRYRRLELHVSHRLTQPSCLALLPLFVRLLSLSWAITVPVSRVVLLVSPFVRLLRMLRVLHLLRVLRLLLLLLLLRLRRKLRLLRLLHLRRVLHLLRLFLMPLAPDW